MKTYTHAEVSAARRLAMEAHRKSLARAEADRIERGWADDDNFEDIWRFLAITSALILAFVIGLGIWSFAASSTKVIEASEVRSLMDECRASGGTPHVDRDREGNVIVARCEGGAK